MCRILPCSFPLLHVLEQMGVPDNLTVAHPVYIVEQIVVKVAYAAPLQLLGKDFLRLSLISDGENGGAWRPARSYPGGGGSPDTC